MEYELSEHAEKVISERELAVHWIEMTLNAPERREPDAADKAYPYSCAHRRAWEPGIASGHQSRMQANSCCDRLF